MLGNFDYFDDEFGLVVFDSTSGILNLKPVTTFTLDRFSEFYYVEDLEVKYYIPRAKLGIDVSNGKRYTFTLCSLDGETIYQSVTFTIGGLTLEEELKNKEDLHLNEAKEQTNILKSIIDFLNPMSENFWGLKLLELLGDMLKALFVPSEDFMSKWFTEISDYFEDAFGILYYPIDLVIQVLGRFSNITDQQPVISFGALSLFGHVLIPAYSYNFNSLLTNNTLETLHSFYLITIDVILWLGLLVYCKNVCANIFGGKMVDEVIDQVQDSDYARYSKHRANVDRYKKEHGGK